MERKTLWRALSALIPELMTSLHEGEMTSGFPTEQPLLMPCFTVLQLTC